MPSDSSGQDDCCNSRMFNTFVSSDCKWVWRVSGAFVSSGYKWMLSALVLVSISACQPESEGFAQESAQESTPALGIPVSEVDLQHFDLIVDQSGDTLPAGSGTPVQGEQIYRQRCQACHGVEGEGTINNTRVAGGDMQSTETPIRTVGSFWPHTTTLFDFVRRAMPADAPKSLSDDEVYQVTAFLLYLNDIIEEDTVIDAESLLEIELPNADGFIDRSTIH